VKAAVCAALVALLPGGAPAWPDTVHTDPAVLGAVGAVLLAADAEGLTAEQTRERFRGLTAHLPAIPALEIRTIRPGLHLVAVGDAVTTRPSTLYLFEGPDHVAIDAGVSGTVQVDAIHADGDRIEVAYFPTPTGGAPRLTSAVVERRDGAWRVDHDTPYRRVSALLARVPPDEMLAPDIGRNPLVLEAFGVFLDHAGRLAEADLHRHMSALFPLEWYRQCRSSTSAGSATGATS
jgi:hypothetical protein